MTAKFVSLNAHKVNVLNLIPYQLTEYFSDNWYGGCRAFVADEHPWLRQTSGLLESLTLSRLDCGLRHVDWVNNIELLKEIVSQATKNEKDLFFGAHDLSQLEFLKSFFGKNSLIIALNYGTHNYDYLLDDLAKTHIYGLKTGVTRPNEHDVEALNTKNAEQLIDHYKTIFDNICFIPKYCDFHGDYEIPFDDYFSPNRMETHFTNIGLPMTNKESSIYYQWFDKFKSGR